MRVPAPALFEGINTVLRHNNEGHTAYLLGQRSQTGFWELLPVALAVKTPIPFLALLLFGAWLCFPKAARSNPWTGLPLAPSPAILVFSLLQPHQCRSAAHSAGLTWASRSEPAAGALRMFDLIGTAKWASYTLAALLVWHGATSALAHPDYIPYFNFLCRPRAGKRTGGFGPGLGPGHEAPLRPLEGSRRAPGGFQPVHHRVPGSLPRLPAHRTDGPGESLSPDGTPPASRCGRPLRLGLGTSEPDLQLWPDLIPPTGKVGKTTYLWYFPPGKTRR